MLGKSVSDVFSDGSLEVLDGSCWNGAFHDALALVTGLSPLVEIFPLFIEHSDVGRRSVVFSTGHRRRHASILSQRWVAGDFHGVVELEGCFPTQRNLIQLLLLHVELLFEATGRRERCLRSLDLVHYLID